MAQDTIPRQPDIPGRYLTAKLTGLALLDETRRLIALRAEVAAAEARVKALRDSLGDPSVPVE